MFAVMYRFILRPGKEQLYQDNWRKVVQFFMQEKGAIGSCLHKTEDNQWVAYSRWSSKEMRDNSWPKEGDKVEDFNLPEEIKLAVQKMKDCVEEHQQELIMNVIDDQLT